MRLLIAALGFLALSLPAQTYQEKIIAAVLAAEAVSEGTQGMSAVAEVIRQRALEKSKTAFQVVTAGNRRYHAFSCLNRSTPDKLYKRWSAEAGYSDALRIAMVLVRQPELLGSATKRATHYTRKQEKPYWAEGRKPVVVIGHHAFYRLAQY